MMLAAAERASQIGASRVPRMSQEADVTVATRDGTLCQIGPIAQDGVNGRLILANKRTSAVVLVPILEKRIEFRDRDYKNAKFSVMIPMLFDTSSSYQLGVKTSSGAARNFYAPSPNISADHETSGNYGTSCAIHLAYFRHASSKIRKVPYWERKTGNP
jgi:hypothetical protein